MAEGNRKIDLFLISSRLGGVWQQMEPRLRIEALKIEIKLKICIAALL